MSKINQINEKNKLFEKYFYPLREICSLPGIAWANVRCLFSYFEIFLTFRRAFSESSNLLSSLWVGEKPPYPPKTYL